MNDFIPACARASIYFTPTAITAINQGNTLQINIVTCLLHLSPTIMLSVFFLRYGDTRRFLASSKRTS